MTSFEEPLYRSCSVTVNAHSLSWGARNDRSTPCIRPGEKIRLLVPELHFSSPTNGFRGLTCLACRASCATNIQCHPAVHFHERPGIASRLSLTETCCGCR